MKLRERTGEGKMPWKWQREREREEKEEVKILWKLKKDRLRGAKKRGGKMPSVFNNVGDTRRYPRRENKGEDWNWCNCRERRKVVKEKKIQSRERYTKQENDCNDLKHTQVEKERKREEKERKKKERRERERKSILQDLSFYILFSLAFFFSLLSYFLISTLIHLSVFPIR